MESRIKILISELGDLRVKQDTDIASFTAKKIPIKVKLFFIAVTVRELVRAVELCTELKIPFLIFGSGSKINLFDLEKFEGLVIKNRADNIKVAGVKGKVSGSGIGVEQAILEAESGISLKRLSEFADEQKLTGLEKVGEQVGTLGGSLRSLFPLQVFTDQVTVLDEDLETVKKSFSEVEADDIILNAYIRLQAK